MAIMMQRIMMDLATLTVLLMGIWVAMSTPNINCTTRVIRTMQGYFEQTDTSIKLENYAGHMGDFSSDIRRIVDWPSRTHFQILNFKLVYHVIMLVDGKKPSSVLCLKKQNGQVYSMIFLDLPSVKNCSEEQLHHLPEMIKTTQVECRFILYTVNVQVFPYYALAMGRQKESGYLYNLICFDGGGYIFTLNRVNVTYIPPECILRIA